MLKDKDGNRLFKRVEVTVWFPKDMPKTFRNPQRKVFSPDEPRQGYSEESIDKILNDMTDWLDATYPFWDFELVPLAPEGRTARYVISYTGIRPLVEPKQESFSHPVATETKTEETKCLG